MKQHSLVESAIERRNHYQGRMAENMSNIIYFTKRKKELVADRDKMKVDTQERAQVNKMINECDVAIQRGQENIEADQMLMESFDELISDLKKDEKKDTEPTRSQ